MIAPVIDFTKVKHKGAVELEWAQNSDTDSLRHSLTSYDDPEPEFGEAMQSLASIVVDLLGLPEGYTEGLTVSGVSLSYNDTQGRGCVITCLKELAAFNAPLVINTPHLAEDAEHGPTMPGALSRALDELMIRATRFKNGQRQQMEMFPEEPMHAEVAE